MGELQIQHPFSLPPPPLPPLPPLSASRDDADPPSASSGDEPPPPTLPLFDPRRMIGIIRRKTLIRDLAAAFHADCLSYCQEILELQNKLDEATWIISISRERAIRFILKSHIQEPFIDIKASENSRKETRRPPKRLKKSR